MKLSSNNLPEIFLAFLGSLEIEYLNAMTPCTLRRLIYLTKGTPIFSYMSDLSFYHEGNDIHCPQADEIIQGLISSGLAVRGEHTDLEITPAGKAYLSSRCLKILNSVSFGRSLNHISNVTSGYHGPYGSRILAVTLFYATRFGTDFALDQLVSDFPDESRDLWACALDRIITDY